MILIRYPHRTPLQYSGSCKFCKFAKIFHKINNNFLLFHYNFIFGYGWVIFNSARWLGYELGDRRIVIRFPAAAWKFLLYTISRSPLWSTQPSIQVPVALSLGVKRLEREAGPSPPSDAQAKTAWSKTLFP